MTTEVLTNRAPAVTPEGAKLRELSMQANEAHRRIDEAARKNLFDALEAGQALMQAKKLCLGEWIVWVRANFKGSARTAQRYMAFATECRRIGGLDATRVSRLTPQQLGQIWTRLLRETSQREKNRAAAKRQAAQQRRESGSTSAASDQADGAGAVGQWTDNQEGNAHPLAEQAG